MQHMKLPLWSRRLLLCLSLALACCANGIAADNSYQQARALQREGKHDEAIEVFKKFLTQPTNTKTLANDELLLYPEALMQLMNTFQSKGAPEACITTLQEVFKSSDRKSTRLNSSHVT